jgi:hypothetical protein
MGFFPYILMFLVGVPVLGAIYFFSFTWLAPLMIVAGVGIYFAYQKLKKK